ncbi:hypothetical protein HRbin11_00746 [bacterium HR11]|nr:hypothetical protein HRbin11_00746 [bacterium HR11]
MRRWIGVTLMVLGLVPWMTGCQSARQVALPDNGPTTGLVTLKGQILQWVNEQGQSLVPSGSVTVRETQTQSNINPDGSFRLPLPQTGTFHLVFRHTRGSEAEVEVQVEDSGEVEVRIMIQGRVGDLVEKIHIHNGKADLMGRVANPSTGPNQFTLQVFDQTYTIQYDSSTNWINTSPAQLKPGDPLEVKGQYTGNSTVLARKIRLHAPQGPKPPEFEAKGTVAGLSGNPCGGSASFTLQVQGGGSVTILVDVQTRFERGTCANLVDGAFVEVKSRRPATGGGWIADEIQFERQEAEFEAKGTVSNLTGNPCAGSASFILQVQGGGSVTILVDAQTRFKKGSCGNLVNGAFVEVKSRRPAANPPGAWIADEIEFEGQEAEFEAKGTVTNAAVTCSPTPSGSFVLNHNGGSTTILVDAQTRFEDGTCANLQNGVRVEVKSRRPQNGAWIADKIEFED